MVNIGEEFSDITFQNPAGFCVVFASFIGKFPESVNGSMRPFAYLAGI